MQTNTWYDLSIDTIILNGYDGRVFFRLSGKFGPCAERVHGKLVEVLHPQRSVWGHFTTWLLGLLRTYPRVGEPPQGEWRLLFVLRLDMHDQARAKRTRAAFSRFHCASDRGWGCKYGELPFTNWRIGNALFPIEKQDAAVAKLQDAHVDEEDVFSKQLKGRFPCFDGKNIEMFHQVVNHTFENCHFDSALIENLNAQSKHQDTERPGGRAIYHSGNCHVVQQAVNVLCVHIVFSTCFHTAIMLLFATI